MTRKNKIMLAAAIVAAVLLVGSGVARCTIVQNGTIEGRAAVESAEEAAVENPQSETDAANGEANSDIESLIGTSWVGVDDATRSLSIVKGAFVETKDGSTEVTYWTLDSEEPLSSGIEATVLASKSMTDAANPILVSVSSEGADTVLRSDALACAHTGRYRSGTGRFTSPASLPSSKRLWGSMPRRSRPLFRRVQLPCPRVRPVPSGMRRRG